MPQPNASVLPDGHHVDLMIAAIQAKVPPEKQAEYDAAMKACMKFLWSDQTLHYMQDIAASLHGPQQVPEVVAEKVKKLINVAVVQASGAKKFMPTTFMVAQACALQVLFYLQQQLRFPITKEIVSQTYQLLAQKMNAMYGIDHKMLQQVAASRKQPSGPAGAKPSGGLLSTIPGTQRGAA